MAAELQFAGVEPYLPESIRELVPLIGLAGVEKLVKRYGGIGVKVPKSVRPDHPLALLLGQAAADQLAAIFGGTRLEVRACQQAIIAVRDAEIRRRHREEGAPAWRLALDYELSERWIWAILAEPEPDGRQSDLFA